MRMISHHVAKQQKDVQHRPVRTLTIDFSSRWSKAAFVRAWAWWRGSPDNKIFFDVDAMLAVSFVRRGRQQTKDYDI